MCLFRSRLLDANNCCRYKTSIGEEYGLNAWVLQNSHVEMGTPSRSLEDN